MSASGPTFKPGLMSNVNPANTDLPASTERARFEVLTLVSYRIPLVIVVNVAGHGQRFVLRALSLPCAQHAYCAVGPILARR